jgi:hypothetical protein
VALEPKNIAPEDTPEVDEGAALWGDVGLEELPEEEPKLEELSREEIEAALGKGLPRGLIFGVVGAVLILVSVLMLTGVFKGKKHPAGEVETIAETKPAPESAADTARLEAQPTAEKAADIEKGSPRISPEEVVDITRGDLTFSEDSIKVDIQLPSGDYFNQLLNAQITPEETGAFDVTDYDKFLLIPIEPLPEAFPPAMRPFPMIPDTLAELMRELQMAPVDTERIFSRLDSLKLELDALQIRLSASEELTDAVMRELEAAALRTDSLRAAEIKRLAKIVDVMKPEAAATMLRDKRDQDIKDVLFRVKPRTAAKVLENFPPDRRSQLAESIVKR